MNDNVSNVLINPEWIQKQNSSSKIRIFDCSWYLKTSPFNGYKIFLDGHIPGTNFYDVDTIADNERGIHQVPKIECFEKYISEMGVNNEDIIVLYDQNGIFCSCRVYYTFKYFGHEKVYILEGGLKLWNEKYEYLLEKNFVKKYEKSKYVVKGISELYKDFFIDYDDVKEIIKTKGKQLIDSRSKGRFNGIDPEPSGLVTSGHIPTSLNVCWKNVLINDMMFKKKDDIKKEFIKAGVILDETKKYVCSCGSGITACILVFALNLAGITKIQNIQCFDGSWVEYASKKDSVILKEEK